ncbi:MAG: 3-phosphoshikimate 1-carboxyvinyltransferase [Candidatus Pacebacteria bacterium]|nr:3-phosphoshikimate 1-carboxyvinyltransferase [Candidatus Paceibacterota bacterium]
MQFVCEPSLLNGTISIPGSKSHTIRAVAIAALADGQSVIDKPLISADTVSALHAVTALGAQTSADTDSWRVTGTGGRPTLRKDTIDVGNSGTTLRLLLGTTALLPHNQTVTLTGDTQIQRRPNAPLIAALNDLGATVVSVHDNGCAPIRVTGTMHGGQTSLEATSSQFVSSLLIACPMAERDTTFTVSKLCERAYIQITMDWLDTQQIVYDHDTMRRFQIPGKQAYKPFHRRIPGDFSSATFFFGAGAIPGNDVTCTGLDLSDSQPDKAVIDYVRSMGANVDVQVDSIRISGTSLHGVDIDMNETPDALPVMAVLGCFANGETTLRNVAQARIKETDRIHVMATELRKMGARVEELQDGLVIHESPLRGTAVNGHADHRVVMALALAATQATGTTTISTAEAAGVTFPEFATLMTSIGAHILSRD